MQQQRQGKPLPLLVLKAEIQSTNLRHNRTSCCIQFPVSKNTHVVHKNKNVYEYRGTFHTDMPIWN